MKLTQEKINKRVADLLQKANKVLASLKKEEITFDIGFTRESNYHDDATEIYFGTLSILEILYGKQSSQVKELSLEYKRIMALKYRQDVMDGTLLRALMGMLTNLQIEISEGLISSIEQQVSAEILTDFLILAKSAYSENNKDVSAVLACAALEDALKKLSVINGLNVTEKSMTEVVNALKSKGILQSNQHALLLPYAKLRNKAFHADWDKFDKAEVGSLISFTEEFIRKNFQ
jgi:hypothetical protein